MRRLLLLALAPIVLVVAAAGPVAAATAYSPPAATAHPTATVSPSGCVQHIDNPHLSKHFGDIAGALRSECNDAVPEISQRVQLWEKRWWGWDRIGRKGDNAVYWVKSLTNWANASCRRSSIKVTGSGYVIDVDGQKYTASTASPTVNNPCHL